MTALHRYLSRLHDTLLSRQELQIEELEILDRSDHYPDIRTFPHHKHIGETVISSRPPDLSEVLREIDGIMYAS